MKWTGKHVLASCTTVKNNKCSVAFIIFIERLFFYPTYIFCIMHLYNIYCISIYLTERLLFLWTFIIF
jgi:hypothetical protein